MSLRAAVCGRNLSPRVEVKKLPLTSAERGVDDEADAHARALVGLPDQRGT